MNNLNLPVASGQYCFRKLYKSRQVLWVFLFFFLLLLLPFLPAAAQSQLLQSGPMVGAAGLNHVQLWVQTKGEATVSFTCYEQEQPDKKWQTKAIETVKENAFTAIIKIENLQPAKKYLYQLKINNKEVKLPYELSFRTLPDTARNLTDIKFAAGSCAYGPADPADITLRIYKQILKQQPEFMLWLGDNVYLGSRDWTSQKGYFKAYTHNRSIEKLQPLLGSVHHYAIWDDHDYGENNANKNWYNKQFARTAFQSFWPNPSYPEEGVYSTFNWADAQFFLLDNRWFRTSNRARKAKREMLGELQLNWLLQELKKSTATFKFICIGSQTLSTRKGRENYKRYGKELKKLLHAIEDANVPGLVVLDGDIHFTELSKYERKSAYPLYGLTVSPLTSTPTKGKKNLNRVPGTLVTIHNFAILEITGDKGNRSLSMRIHDSLGNQLWERSIHQNELKE